MNQLACGGRYPDLLSMMNGLFYLQWVVAARIHGFQRATMRSDKCALGSQRIQVCPGSHARNPQLVNKIRHGDRFNLCEHFEDAPAAFYGKHAPAPGFGNSPLDGWRFW